MPDCTSDGQLNQLTLGPFCRLWLVEPHEPAAVIGFLDRIGETAFEEAFQILLKRSDSTDVGLSFMKRISHRGMKYALIYHAPLGKDSDALDTEDFGFAAKLCALNLRDLRKVLDLYVQPEAGDKATSRDPVDAVVAQLKKIQAAGGKAAVPSTL